MGVRGLQRPAPYAQENLGHWGREGHNKGDKPGRSASLRKENADNPNKAIEVLHSKLPGVPVETRRCIGVVH